MVAQLLPYAGLSPPGSRRLSPLLPGFCLFNPGRAGGCQLWTCHDFAAVLAAALWFSGNFLSQISRAENQAGSTHRSMMAHSLLLEGQVGGQMLQNMAASEAGVGQVGHGHDQYSESPYVEAESSGGISTRESWGDSHGLHVQAGKLKNIDKLESSFSFCMCRGKGLQGDTEGPGPSHGALCAFQNTGSWESNGWLGMAWLPWTSFCVGE